MSKKQFTRYEVILKTIDGSLTIEDAALCLNLSSHGFKSPKTRRRYKPHRRRSRKPQAGLLLQIDATSHRWFKNDRKSYSLHGSIDDATGQITSLFMTKNECLLGYFQMLHDTICNFGIPVSIYADRHTIFQSPNSSKADIDSNVNCNDTQFARALKELGIELIPARSPQAKGRIERLWQTLQSRLPIEFDINGISDVTSANQFLKQYIYEFNSQFAVEPKDSQSLFVPVDNSINLDYILCSKNSRKVDSGGVSSFKGKSFKLPNNEYTKNIYAGTSIDVLSSPSFGIMAQYRGVALQVIPFIPPKRKKSSSKSKSEYKTTAHKVPLNHPYKFGNAFSSPLIESNDEIIDMLENIFLSAY